MKFLSLALVGTILPLVHAIGNAVITNHCEATIYVWSVASSITNYQVVASNQSYTEQYRNDPQTGGITLKVATVTDGIFTNSPELDYGYTLDNHTIWYDISTTNGNPFAGSSVALVPSIEGSCRSYIWEDGVSPPGINTAPCNADMDMLLTLC
ncbi:hypothetical protein TMatcc_003446 [Talaromyces marneffei ATCC 18224]|uniref:BYS1 domain protein, putative n=2 Tax=Talaromyces marneffei TaxID=37727 RepID=B6Q4C6_TALMQ|nr:uncharacterized protein EYB26_001507 [Talaromyces marneffei]EEA28232.1 BYS1 domain protein, putative [Talaromyces marneffei ATCC 18224]KAE8556126.1 hypothetical protein EYB25_000826 [Talaromyces marneffei]QGA13856.1 hypothetical protein EYB26_001507 [Talaromyces marneffei]